MSSAICNITRFSAQHPPHWTSIKYKHGLTEEWNQGINTKDCTSRLRKLKDTALTLYRQLALKAEEKKTGGGSTTPAEGKDTQETLEDELNMGKNNRRKGKLAKLKPAGTAETLGAMVDDHGNIITKHEDMADLLQNRWSRVFSHKTPQTRPPYYGLTAHTHQAHPARRKHKAGNPAEKNLSAPSG